MSETLARITRARSRLIQDHCFYGVAVMHLDPVAAPHITDTMATDGAKLFYSPEFVATISEPELIGVLAHEADHCMRGHHARMQSRELEDWNVATDYCINGDLLNAGFQLPAGVLVAPEYAGQGAEEIYAQIHHGKDEQKSEPESGDGAPDDDGDGQEGDGDGDQGQPGKPGKPDAAKHGIGGIMMPANPADAEALADKWQAVTRQAAAIAKANNAGNLPGYAKAILDDISGPVIDCRDVLAHLIDSRATFDYSFSSPNRRYISGGVYLPGQVFDSIEHLIFAVDTSGSIDFEMLKTAVGVVIGAIDSGKVERVTVLHADTAVRAVQEFVKGDDIAGAIEPAGGGGTAFEDTFRWIEENAPDATAMIYLTDMECDRWGDEPLCPVFWAIHGDSRNYERLAERAPFGEAIYIGRLE